MGKWLMGLVDSTFRKDIWLIQCKMEKEQGAL